MKIAVLEPRSVHQKNIIRDVLYGCWCGGKRIAGGTVPPFGALRVATILKKEGHDAIFVDAQAEQLEFDDVVRKLEGARLVIFSSSVMTINNDSEYIGRLKERIPGLKVAAYGSFPTFNPKAAIGKGIDYAVRREPEWILRDLSEVLSKGELDEVNQITGIAHAESGSTFQKNAQHSFIENVDSLPPIDLNLLPKKVNYFNPLVKQLPYITTSTSYGCPGKCTFCTAPFFQGATLRMQSAEKVLSDIKHYLEGGMKEIYFRDETFTADKQRVIDICKGIIERGYKFSWICNARTDCADRDMLEWMKKAGCHYVKFGVESGNQEVLDASKKGITLQQTRDAFRHCNELGLDTHAHFMIGMPLDTPETVQQTIDFAIEINPTTATFGICTPYPGTPLFAKVFYNDKSIGDGAENAAMNRLHVEGEYNHLYCSLSAGDLKVWLKRAYWKFYFRPRYFLKMLKRIRNLNMMRNLIIGGTNIASFTADS